MSEQPTRPQPQQIDRGDFGYDRRDANYSSMVALGRMWEQRNREIEILRRVRAEMEAH